MRNVYRAFFAITLVVLRLPDLAAGQDSMHRWGDDTSAASFTQYPTTPYPTTSAKSAWGPTASSGDASTYLRVAQREQFSRVGSRQWTDMPGASRQFGADFPPESYGLTAQRPVREIDVSPIDSSGYLHEEPIASSPSLLEPTDYRCREGSLQARLARGMRRSWTDHHHYYSCDTLYPLLLSLGACGVVANTSLDQSFQDWYQNDVRSQELDHFSDFWRPCGNGFLVIPFFLGLSVVSGLYEDGPVGSVVAKFSGRVVRSSLVGAPPMVALQSILGSSRPGEVSDGSHWKPFDDTNAVSGHAFIGALPFITAAQMTDHRSLKTALYLCSALPAWSRVNDDKHYLSQACVGWWMAYLACAAVNKTDLGHEHLTFSPIASSEMMGLAMVFQR